MSEVTTEGASNGPIMDRGLIARPKSYKYKFLAFAFVAIMVVSALAVAVPAMMPESNDDGSGAQTTWANGDPERTLTIVNYGYEHRKDQLFNRTDFANAQWEKLGRHSNHNTGVSTEGVNSWHWPRETTYGEYILRGNTAGGLPFIMAWDAYGGLTTPDAATKMGYYIMTPVRMEATFKNITQCRTTNDAYFIPDLQAGPTGANNGNITLKMYMTYLLDTENTAARAVSGLLHYARWFYGGARASMMGAAAWDGYVFEVQGKVTMDRWAARGYLGAPATGDLQTWWAANDEGGIEDNWFFDWETEATGIYDIWTAYEDTYYPYGYEIRVDAPNCSANTNSMTDTITLLFWHQSWGDDPYMARLIEAAGLTFKDGAFFNDYIDELYLNVTMNNAKANATLAADMLYQCGAWEDESATVWNGAWNIEPDHLDYLGNEGTHTGYTSPFNAYDPDQFAPDRTRHGCVPGTTLMDKQVSYWIGEKNFSLAEHESLIVKLEKNRDFVGIKPFIGTTTAAIPNPNDITDVDVRNRLKQNMYWGRMALGDGCAPRSSFFDNYNPTTGIVTMTGPMAMAGTNKYTTPNALSEGRPKLIIDILTVSSYQVAISGSSPRLTATPYTLTVTAKNASGTTITSSTLTGVYNTTGNPGKWNATVTMSCNIAATFGSTSHTYIAGDNGVWTSTVTFNAAGTNVYVNASGQLPVDVKGSNGPSQVNLIPEFGTLLVPVIGAMAVFLVFRMKKRKSEDQ